MTNLNSLSTKDLEMYFNVNLSLSFSNFLVLFTSSLACFTFSKINFGGSIDKLIFRSNSPGFSNQSLEKSIEARTMVE